MELNHRLLIQSYNPYRLKVTNNKASRIVILLCLFCMSILAQKLEGRFIPKTKQDSCYRVWRLPSIRPYQADVDHAQVRSKGFGERQVALMLRPEGGQPLPVQDEVSPLIFFFQFPFAFEI